MEKIFYNRTTDRAYREDGSDIANKNMPAFRYKTKRQLAWQYINSLSKDENGEFDDFYTGFTGQTITASFAVDNNSDHYFSGALNTAVTGTITEIEVKALSGTPRIAGTIQLTNSAGDTESVNYNTFTELNGVYMFKTADSSFAIGAQTLTNSYVADDAVRVLELPIIKTENADIDQTNKDTGLFIITVNSKTLIFGDLVEGSEQIQNCHGGLKIYDSTAELIEEKTIGVRCLGLLDDDGGIPPAPDGDFYNKTEVEGLIAATPDEKVKCSSNDTTDGYLEDKLVTSSGTNIALPIEVSTLNDGADEDVQIQFDESKVVHQNLSGAGVNDHAQIDTHIADTANPHATDVGNLGSGTLAELNTAITDATLDDVSGARTPTAHAASHQALGSDAIKLDDLDAPEDNTDLNASTLAHGLMHKLSGSSSEYFAGDGTWQTPAGTGDVVGPASSTDLAICIFDGTTGKLIKSSGVIVDTSNNICTPGDINIIASTTETKTFQIGQGRTDNGISLIDLIGDPTYTDYGVRLIRYAGLNGGATLTSRGLGALTIKTEEAGAIAFATTAVTRMTITATGEIGIGTTSPAYKLDVEGGIRETDAPDVSWTTATKTLALTEAGTEIIADSVDPQTLTIPADASVAFNVGVKLVVYMVGAGAVTIAGDTGVTVNGVSAGSGTMTQYTAVELKKIAADTWIVIGNVTIA